MALHLNDRETDRLARELAERTGETLTGAVQKALKERLERITSKQSEEEERFLADIRKIQSRVSPELRNSKKTAREMIDELYDDDGLPR